VVSAIVTFPPFPASATIAEVSTKVAESVSLAVAANVHGFVVPLQVPVLQLEKR
jgi:hypothetical protein